jgi:hypothetical protein
MNASRHSPPAPRIELFYVDGCPGYEQLLPNLRRLTETTDAILELHLVETVERARAARFLGSPTVRVNGRDVEPGAEQRTDYGIKCRLYRTESGWANVLPPEWITAALARASTR